MKRTIFIIIFFLTFSNARSQAFSLDTTFNMDYNFYPLSISYASIYDILFEPDGKIMVYGEFEDGYTSASIKRIYNDGSIDNTFTFLWDFGVTRMKRINNDYLIFNSNFYHAKLNYFGQHVDTSWTRNIDRLDICSILHDPYIWDDGSMLVGTDSICNSTGPYSRWFKKYFPDGNMDTNFMHYPNGMVGGVFKYSSDKFLLWAEGPPGVGFTKYDNQSAVRMCRIDSAGNFDTTFHSIFADFGLPKPIYVQNDGKIIVGGAFILQNDLANYRSFIRLNANGSLDTTFNNNIFCTSNFANLKNVIAICPTPDGGYLIGGDFKSYQGFQRKGIAKIDINGFLDTTYFANGQGIDSVHYYLNLNPYITRIYPGLNDTYYVMGMFKYYNGQKVQPIIRIKGLSSGINENKKEKTKLNIYPNPATTQTTIFYPIAEKAIMLQIYNMLGQMVYEEKLSKGSNQCTINTNGFKAGLYKVVVGESSGTLIIN